MPNAFEAFLAPGNIQIKLNTRKKKKYIYIYIYIYIYASTNGRTLRPEDSPFFVIIKKKKKNPKTDKPKFFYFENLCQVQLYSSVHTDKWALE